MRSSFKVSAARSRAGSMVRMYSARNPWTPAAVSGCFLHRMRFTSPTQVSVSSSVAARSLLLGFSIAYSTRSQLNTWFVHLLAQAVENLCSDPANDYLRRREITSAAPHAANRRVVEGSGTTCNPVNWIWADSISSPA